MAAKKTSAKPVIRPRLSVVEQAARRARNAGFQWELPKSDIYVFASATDRSPVHREQFAAIRHYIKHRRLQGWRTSFHAIPVLMHAVTRRRGEDFQTIELWDKPIRPYLFAGRSDLIPHLTIAADFKVQPTAVNPLNGLAAMSGRRSVLIGHPKLALTTVATPGSSLPKILTTTGSITALDYTDSRLGKIAEFHHSQCAVAVEVDWVAEKFWMTQLTASTETGEFTDMEWHYTPIGRRRAERPEALDQGDTHYGFHSREAERAKFGPDGLVERLKPRRIIWHDLKDGYSHNHHEDKDVFVRAGKMGTWAEDVRREVVESVRYAEGLTPPDCQSIIVASNHDEFLTRWIKEQDWKKLTSQGNMLFYLQTAAKMLEGQKLTERGVETPSPFVIWGREIADPKKIRFLSGSEEYIVKGVALHMHGHDGPNGARGNVKNLARIGTKSIIQHGHGPNIWESAWQGGTNSILDPVYVRGPSNWMCADVVLHATGKRQMLFTIDGRTRLGTNGRRVRRKRTKAKR